MSNVQQFRDALFHQVMEQIKVHDVPARVPQSLFNFVERDDVLQQFFLGVSKRLLKVKRFKKSGQGRSPEVGYLIDGGVKAVQDMIRATFNRNIIHLCQCGVTYKTGKPCKKCGQVPVTQEATVEMTDGHLVALHDNGMDAVDAKLMLTGFAQFLRDKSHQHRVYDLFLIVTGNNTGPCLGCKEPCKGAIMHFEVRGGKWQSGCVNVRAKVADHWGISVNRVGFLLKRLNELAGEYATGTET